MKYILFSIASLLLAGCVYQQAEVKSPAFDEQLAKPKPSYTGGSLWQDSSSGLAEDAKARRKGDILTILIAEQSSASKQANTATKRDTSASAGIPNLLGLESAGFARTMNLANLVNASYASKYDGSGSTSRNENLLATITAKVTDILPNGNLLIEGRRNVKVNNEEQVIVLEGTVRPRDISTENVINSSNIADAKISYTGNGVLSDRQRPGWLMNFLERLWPF